MSGSMDNLVNQIEMEIKGKEEMESHIEMIEHSENKKVSITSRFDVMQAAYLNMLAEKTDMSRSALVAELATSALMEVMKELDLEEEFFSNLSNVKKVEEEEV